MAWLDRAVGIDLGTTNSEIAWLPPDERELVIYADRFGRRTMPSAVAWDEAAQQIVVGHKARGMRGANASLVESVKRKMGRTETIAMGPHALDPAEISSKILVELTSRMRETLESRARDNVSLPLTRAVITVPAYFDAPQVEATRKAGELAGLSVIGILQEPTAAAIYHAWKRRLGDGVFLVYDLGGGTFDVSILRCVAGEYQVLAIDGDNYLGGDDFDRIFAEHLRKRLAEQGYALDLDVRGSPDDRRKFERLVHLAQEIKESLSTTDVVHVTKNDFVVDKSGENVSLDAEIGRVEYEGVISDLVRRTLACAERALVRAQEVAGVGLVDVDHVVLVGGSTRVPLVRRLVTESFCKDGHEVLAEDVDTCVALGAAVHAASIGGTIVGSDRARVRVSTPLVAHAAKLRVGLSVEQAPEGATHLAIWDDDRVLAEGRLEKDAKGAKEGSTALRFDVALGESPSVRTTLAFQSSVGAPLEELPLPLARGDLRPRPTALSRVSVVAKDVALEVTRSGKCERKVLLARGTGLPAQATHVFFTADQTGAVVLRLLQNRLPIRTLVVDVPKELPVGSPVELVLRCDESMRMEAHASVGAQHVRAHIEAPELALSDWSDVEALLERAEHARRTLWGGLGQAFAREADALSAGIREVLHTDPDKLRALCARLGHLLSEVQGSGDEELVPPMARMEESFDTLRRVVYRAADGLMGMRREEWETRIDDLHDKAMRAHRTNDGPVWRRVFNEVQALWETAFQEEFAAMRLDDPAYVKKRLGVLVFRAERVDARLRDVVLSTTPEIANLQNDERARLRRLLEAATNRLRTLEKRADLVENRHELDEVDSELDRVDAAVERLPSMGLVTDRGAR